MHTYFDFRTPRWILVAFCIIGILIAHPRAAGQSRKQGRRPVTVNAPEWYNVRPSLRDTLVARGKGKSNDEQVAIDKAVAEARSTLARVIELRWKELLRAVEEEGGSRLEWKSEPVTLTGSQPFLQKVFRRGKLRMAYVLVTIPERSVRHIVLQRLHRNGQWYEGVRNTQAVRAIEATPP